MRCGHVPNYRTLAGGLGVRDLRTLRKAVWSLLVAIDDELDTGSGKLGDAVRASRRPLGDRIPDAPGNRPKLLVIKGGKALDNLDE